MTNLAEESRRFERRVREAPELVGIDPVRQINRSRVATIAVLLDLLLLTIHPDHFDERLLTPLEKGTEQGDIVAAAKLRWINLWGSGTDNIALVASDAEIAFLLESGRLLINQLFVLVNKSNEQTGEPRFSELYRTLKSLESEPNYLAGACLVYLESAFQEAQFDISPMTDGPTLRLADIDRFVARDEQL